MPWGGFRLGFGMVYMIVGWFGDGLGVVGGGLGWFGNGLGMVWGWFGGVVRGQWGGEIRVTIRAGLLSHWPDPWGLLKIHGPTPILD